MQPGKKIPGREHPSAHRKNIVPINIYFSFTKTPNNHQKVILFFTQSLSITKGQEHFEPTSNQFIDNK